MKKCYSNLVFCLFVGIQVYLNKTDLVDIYPARTGVYTDISEAVLKHLRLSIYFDLSGKIFQIFGPRNETFSAP